MANPADSARIITAARACLGVPFLPQGRHAALGLDCAGLVIHAFAAAGIVLPAPADYPFPPPGAVLIASLAAAGFIQTQAMQPAALLLFRFGGRAQHLALATRADPQAQAMIHAFAPAGRVIETSVGSAWLPRLLGIYLHPSLS